MCTAIMDTSLLRIGKGRDRLYYYRANSSRNAIIRANRPVASARANPRIAYENSCLFGVPQTLTNRHMLIVVDHLLHMY